MKPLWMFVLFSTASLALSDKSKIPRTDFLYACSGATVTVPWQSNNITNHATDIKWFHHLNSDKQEMVAVYTNKLFLAVRHGVSRLPDNRLTMGNVSVIDSGLYDVQVFEEDTDTLQFNFTFYLQVSDGPMVKDGELEVRQDSVALWNETSKQWTIRLLCGTFTFKGDDAPIEVEWIMPNGKTRASKNYHKGYFYMAMATPVRDDRKYTCFIPPRFYPDICLTNKTAGAGLTEASLFVDEVKTRLTVSEAEQERLGNVVANLSNEFRAESTKLEKSIIDITSELTAKGHKISSIEQHMSQTIGDLSSLHIGNGQQLNNSEKKREKNSVNPSSPLIDGLPQVCLSTHHTFINDTNGLREVSYTASKSLCDDTVKAGTWYRAYVRGQNADIPTSCTTGSNRCGTKAPMWLDLEGKSLPTLGQEVQGRACITLESNCCRWNLAGLAVVNCGNFFVYKLRPSARCASAYCLKQHV